MSKPIEEWSNLNPEHVKQILENQRMAHLHVVDAGMAMVDAICDKDESLSPRHTHSDILGIVSTGVLGDY